MCRLLAAQLTSGAAEFWQLVPDAIPTLLAVAAPLLAITVASTVQSLVGTEATLIAAACVVLAAAAIVGPLPAIRGIRASERPRPLALAAAASEQAT